MNLIFELFFLLSVLSILYFFGIMHIMIINLKILRLRRSISLFSLFFFAHISGLLLLHLYMQLMNPLPFWQWGNRFGGDEINFYNFMKFFFQRFEAGNYRFDYINQQSLDYSIWIYILSSISYLMPTSEITAYFVPKLVSSFFVSLTSFYTVLYARKISDMIDIRLLVIFLLLTPDFYYLASGIFRAPIIAYCLIMVLFLAKREKGNLQIKEIFLYLPLLAFILLWLLPNLKIFLNLLLICIIIACVLSKNRWAFVATSAAVLSVLVFNVELILTSVSFFDSNGFGSLASRVFVTNEAGASGSSLGQALAKHSYFAFVLANVLQFFITVPFWSPITSFVGEARAPMQTLVILSSHFTMSLLLPGLLSLKTKAPKNFVWLLFPILIFSLSMGLTGTVLNRWRFPIMPLIVVVLSIGYQAPHTKLKISYFVGLAAVYALYFALKGL